MGQAAFTSLTTVIVQFSQSYGLEMRMLESRLKRDWDQVVGPHLAAHTWPEMVKFKKLVLLAENSVWLQQLVFLKPALLEKIHVIPQGFHISDIVLRVGEIPIHRSSETQYDNAHSSQITASNNDLSFAKAMTSSIKNPELQTLLRTVIAKALSFKKFSSHTARGGRN